MDNPAGAAFRPSRPSGWSVFDPRRSLRARAALITAATCVLFTAALAAITTRLLRQSLETQLGAGFESLAFQLSDKIDRTIYDRYRTLLLTASLDALRRWETPAPERRRLLESVLETSPDFAWIGFADSQGRVIAATRGTLENQEAATRSWFRGAREQPYIGSLREMPELARAPEGGNVPRLLDLAVPVTAADGNFAGVLVGLLRWNWSRDVQASVVPDAAARERIAVTLYQQNEVLLDSGGHGWTHPPEPPALGEARRLRGSLLEATPEGTTFLSGFARSRGFREYRGIGWLAVVRQPVDRAFGAVPVLRRSILVWGAVLTAAAVVASWLVAGRLVRRMRSVRASAIRIHEGDILAVLPRPAGESEMAQMCHALGDLVEDLRTRPEKSSAENQPASPASSAVAKK